MIVLMLIVSLLVGRTTVNDRKEHGRIPSAKEIAL